MQFFLPKIVSCIPVHSTEESVHRSQGWQRAILAALSEHIHLVKIRIEAYTHNGNLANIRIDFFCSQVFCACQHVKIRLEAAWSSMIRIQYVFFSFVYMPTLLANLFTVEPTHQNPSPNVLEVCYRSDLTSDWSSNRCDGFGTQKDSRQTCKWSVMHRVPAPLTTLCQMAVESVASCVWGSEFRWI